MVLPTLPTPAGACVAAGVLPAAGVLLVAAVLGVVIVVVLRLPIAANAIRPAQLRTRKIPTPRTIHSQVRDFLCGCGGGYGGGRYAGGVWYVGWLSPG